MKKVTQVISSNDVPVAELNATNDIELNIWQDANLVKLIEALVSGKITDIKPVIDISYRNAVSYPAINALLGTSHEQTLALLDTLADQAILNKNLVDKLYVDPDGSCQLIPVGRCPYCDSANLESGRLLEHYSCGNVQLEKYYHDSNKMVCPKCRHELKVLGTDYSYLGEQYRCLDCENLFASPVIKWRNLKTGTIWPVEKIGHISCYRYDFNNSKKQWLEFQLKPKRNLVEYLRTRGYDVKELAEVKGSSGAIHTLDILACRDDVLTKLRLGIAILTNHDKNQFVTLEDVFRFDIKAYDLNLEYKAIVAIPKLAEDARLFAERQKISVFETDDMNCLMFHIEEQSGISPGEPIRRDDAGNKDDFAAADAMELPLVSEKITSYFQDMGYIVTRGKTVKGKSGIAHKFDIYAQRDDLLIQPSVAIDIKITDMNGALELDNIVNFDAKTYDSGIRNRTFVAIPKASTEAQQFAASQGILLVDWLDLNRIFSFF